MEAMKKNGKKWFLEMPLGATHPASTDSSSFKTQRIAEYKLKIVHTKKKKVKNVHFVSDCPFEASQF